MDAGHPVYGETDKNSGTIKKMNKHLIYGHFDRCRCFSVSIRSPAMWCFNVGDSHLALLSLSLSLFLFAQPVIFLDSIVYFCVCFEQYAHAVATTAAEAVASIREKKDSFLFSNKRTPYRHLFHL